LLKGQFPDLNLLVKEGFKGYNEFAIDSTQTPKLKRVFYVDTMNNAIRIYELNNVYDTVSYTLEVFNENGLLVKKEWQTEDFDLIIDNIYFGNDSMLSVRNFNGEISKIQVKRFTKGKSIIEYLVSSDGFTEKRIVHN